MKLQKRGICPGGALRRVVWDGDNNRLLSFFVFVFGTRYRGPAGEIGVGDGAWWSCLCRDLPCVDYWGDNNTWRWNPHGGEADMGFLCEDLLDGLDCVCKLCSLLTKYSNTTYNVVAWTMTYVLLVLIPWAWHRMR